MSKRLLIALSIFLGAVSCVFAHPHVFVEARSSLVFDNDGKAVAVQHVFRFDDAFSAFAIQGFDKNQDGNYSRDELSELAKINIESMADFGYFTFGDNTRVELDFETPTNFWLEVATVDLQDYWVMKPEDFQAIQEDIERDGGSAPDAVELLELHFTLPLKEASDSADPITLDVYDPTYYVDFRFSREDEAVGTVNAPGACQVTRKEPPPLDEATAYALSQIGPDQRDLPPELQSAAATQVNQLIVNCAATTADVSANDVAEQNVQSAALETPDANSAQSAQTSDVKQSGPAEDAASDIGYAGRFFGMIALKQKEFYRELVGSLRAFRSNPNAFWLLVGLSFGYGVFHAAGPGHGKAIITSYVLASNETLKKGVILSFASAFAQAVTAIVLVGGLTIAFNLTSIAIQETARWFEIGSYILITALGAWLLWQKALGPLLTSIAAHMSGRQVAIAGHSHGHDHGGHTDHHHIGVDGICTTCGHAHAPTPEMVQGKITLQKALSIVLAVGLRPCTGALVVLVFALSQDMIAAGVVSTLAMAVGTGITVSVLAGLAVTAKELAIRLFGGGSPAANRVLRAIEVVGAAIVFLLGAMLLTAAVGWGV